MKKQTILDIIYGAAFVLIFGGALLADGLCEIRGWFAALAAIVAVGGVLVYVGNYLEREFARQGRGRKDDR